MARKVAAHVEITQAEVLDELAARYGKEPRRAGDVTAIEVARALSISETGARSLLRREVDAGRLERVRVAGGGVVWRKKSPLAHDAPGGV